MLKDRRRNRDAVLLQAESLAKRILPDFPLLVVDEHILRKLRKGPPYQRWSAAVNSIYNQQICELSMSTYKDVKDSSGCYAVVIHRRNARDDIDHIYALGGEWELGRIILHEVGHWLSMNTQWEGMYPGGHGIAWIACTAPLMMRLKGIRRPCDWILYELCDYMHSHDRGVQKDYDRNMRVDHDWLVNEMCGRRVSLTGSRINMPIPSVDEYERCRYVLRMVAMTAIQMLDGRRRLSVEDVVCTATQAVSNSRRCFNRAGLIVPPPRKSLIKRGCTPPWNAAIK